MADINNTDYKQPDVIVYQDLRPKPEIPEFNWSGFDASSFIKAFSKKRGVTERESELTNLLSSLATGGNMGKSAYEIWIDAGNTGTVEDFLDSLIGPKGDDGESAYQTWIGLGNVGSKQDFVNSLVGTAGKSSYELWLELGNSGTAQDFVDYLKNSASHVAEFTNVDTFLVEHNMGRFPTVNIVDINKVLCLTQVRHINENALRINMSKAKSGWVFCS